MSFSILSLSSLLLALGADMPKPLASYLRVKHCFSSNSI
jgi:hypothetical protein